MINKSYDEKIVAWLEKNRETVLQKWMELVKIPSVQGPAQPNAPFGVECARALKTAAANMEALGVPVQLNEEDGYAFAEIGQGEKCIGLFGHSDVVPAGDGWLYTQPFEPVIREGMLFGRGAGDNKSGVMASWCVLAMLKECEIPLRNRLRVFVGSNEESGMQDMVAYAAKEETPDINLVPDSRFPCGLGEKGILRLWARCDQPLTAVQDMTGGSAFNTVLDRMEATLKPNAELTRQLQEACTPDSGCSVAVDGDGTIRLAADGVAKHAAYPEGSVNATQRAAQLLASCQSLPAGDRQILATVADFLQGCYGEGLDIAHEDPDFGALTCANGMVKVEDGHLMISLDIRYGITCDPDALEQKLQSKWTEAGWQIVHMDNRPGYGADPESPFPEVWKAISEELCGRELSYYRVAGGTYGRYLKNAFPVGHNLIAADRVGTTMELPAGHGAAHQRDEAADIEGFFLGVRALAHYVLACDQLLTNNERKINP